jgi:hypothetical protein
MKTYSADCKTNWLSLLLLATLLSGCAALFSFDNVAKYRISGIPGIWFVAPGPGTVTVSSTGPITVLASSGECIPVGLLEGDGFAVKCSVTKALAAIYLCRIPLATKGKPGEPCVLSYSLQATTPEGEYMTALYEP